MAEIDFYQCSLTPEEKVILLQRISNVRKVGKCRVWGGNSKTSDGYGFIMYIFRGVNKKLTVHRLKYFLKTDCKLLKSMDVSHLCHNKLCIRSDHLSYEPHRINCKRNICKSNGECEGHRGYRPCILE